MKYMKYIIVVAITFLVTMSCEDDFLDRSPYDSISSANIWKTDVNAQRGVNGIYHALDHFRSAGQNFMWAFSNFGPDGTTFNGGAIIQGNSTSRSSNWLGNDYRAYYTEMYRIIRFSNDAIANLTDNPNISEDLRKRLIGEAKFFRGFGYFYLWDLFGDVVLIKEPVKPDETDKARAPASEVKKLIVSDFKDARDRLPVTYEESNRGRVTQGAAVAMLGKTYLYDKDYKDAADVFENLMSSPYEYALHPEYYQLFNFKWEYNDEVIFAIDEIMLPGLGNEYDMRYGNRSTNTGGWNNSLATYTAVDNYTHRDGSPINMSTMPQRDDYKTGGEVDEVAYGEALIDWYQATFTKEDVDKRL
ncbi:MAG: RagB/SusD family nutrient uptake outer membrane protein, partial [Candidatus Paceibacterota bacterium]